MSIGCFGFQIRRHKQHDVNLLLTKMSFFSQTKMLNCDKNNKIQFFSVLSKKKVVQANQCEQTDKNENKVAVLTGTTLTLMIKPVLYSKMTKGIVVVNHCIEVKFIKLPIFFFLITFLNLSTISPKFKFHFSSQDE